MDADVEDGCILVDHVLGKKCCHIHRLTTQARCDTNKTDTCLD